MASRQRHVYELERSAFPTDFPERLETFREAAGLTWRELARLLRLDVRTIHRWRNGTRPDAGRLIALFNLASERQLLHLLLPAAGRTVQAANSGSRGGLGVHQPPQSEPE